jgi:YggT family protein
MASFILFVVNGLLSALIWAIIVSAVMSWLVAFDVINLRNPFVANIARFLDAVTRPILRPIQRLVPPLGGVDITPIIALLVIQGTQIYLLPILFRPLIAIAG